jgi:hypothetical protein
MVMKVLAQVESDNTDKVYEIRVGRDFRAYCTCSAWKFSKCNPKSCKHLVRFMCDGADYIGSVPNNPVAEPQGFVIRAILLD